MKVHFSLKCIVYYHFATGLAFYSNSEAFAVPATIFHGRFYVKQFYQALSLQ